MHCKEQAGNNGIGPAMVSYSLRLVRRRAQGFWDFPPSPVSNSMGLPSLSGFEERAPLRRGRASAQQKARSSTPRGPVGANLVNALFSKILVTRVNRKIC